MHGDVLPTANVVDFLEPMGEASRGRVLENSTRLTFPAGTIAYRAGGPPTAAIIERGLIRVFMGSVDGRQATIAYLHGRELLGAILVMDRPAQADAQVVTDATLLQLDFDHLQRLVATDVEVASAMATTLASRLSHSFRLVTIRSLGSIRDRLAYDLLERCCESQLASGEMVLEATHADLADAIGSSREVVTRTLSDLRRAGIIVSSPGTVRVIDPMRLAAIVRGLVS